MSRTNELRRLAARLVVESNRLDRLSEDLQRTQVPYWSKKVRELQRTIYHAHIAVGELADAARDPRGAKRQPSMSGPTAFAQAEMGVPLDTRDHEAR